MAKFFNTAGPVNPEKHYYVPHRFNEKEIRELIDQEKYFILHAPRQSGKTTGIIQLTKMINGEGKYKALYVNFEPAQTARGNRLEGIAVIMSRIREEIERDFGAEEPGLAFFKGHSLLARDMRGDELQGFLSYWSAHSSKPIVFFIDEIDSLIGDTLISVLRQLRAGYTYRPHNFPQSVCLVGVRDVRDYRIYSDEAGAMVLGGSAFNIKASSTTRSAEIIISPR